MRDMLRSFAVGLGIVILLGGPALALSFTVDSTGDSGDTSAGDGACVATGGGCTLRAAMQEANALPDADTIAFDIAGSGLHTIHVVGGQEGGSDLPFIVAPLTIDGFKQHDSQPNTNATGGLNAVPLIELDGSGSSHCFVVFNSGTNTIRGLVMNGFHSDAVDLESGSTTFIEGNFIGTDATGTTAKGLATGVNMFVQNGGLTFTVGGTTPDARNLISGSTNGGISVGVLRQAFLAPAEPLRADTKTLRKGVHCPGDATGG
jgi:CSLREA domain-containing protein